MTSERQTESASDCVNATLIDYLGLSNDFSGFYKRPINVGTWQSTNQRHIQDVAFDGDVTKSNSIQDGDNYES